MVGAAQPLQPFLCVLRPAPALLEARLHLGRFGAAQHLLLAGTWIRARGDFYLGPQLFVSVAPWGETRGLRRDVGCTRISPLCFLPDARVLWEKKPGVGAPRLEASSHLGKSQLSSGPLHPRVHSAGGTELLHLYHLFSALANPSPRCVTPSFRAALAGGAQTPNPAPSVLPAHPRALQNPARGSRPGVPAGCSHGKCGDTTEQPVMKSQRALQQTPPG